MIEAILLLIIFIMGAYFGSFFTLATYRIPKNENIMNKHSYCPSCNHKLGVFDLVPIFSYLFLGTKCRYCQKPIGIRYFLFEILTGLVFVLFTLSLKINIFALDIKILVYFLLAILYFTSLFILAGIAKEKNVLQKSVLGYGMVVSIFYIIYSYTLTRTNVYEYVIYLCFMIVLMMMDIYLFKKKLKYEDWIQLLILILYMLIFSGTYIVIYSIILSVMAMGFRNILLGLRSKKTVIKEKKKIPFTFFLCTSNILAMIISNFIMNYMIK